MTSCVPNAHLLTVLSTDLSSCDLIFRMPRDLHSTSRVITVQSICLDFQFFLELIEKNMYSQVVFKSE